MSAMTDDTYNNLLHGIVEELVEGTNDRKLFSGSEFDTGYRFALYAVLSLIQVDAKGFLIEPKEIGFGTFSVDDWFRLGAEHQR